MLWKTHQILGIKKLSAVALGIYQIGTLVWFLQENMILQLTNQLQIEGEEKRKLHVVIEEQERCYIFSPFEFLWPVGSQRFKISLSCMIIKSNKCFKYGFFSCSTVCMLNCRRNVHLLKVSLWYFIRAQSSMIIKVTILLPHKINWRKKKKRKKLKRTFCLTVHLATWLPNCGCLIGNFSRKFSCQNFSYSPQQPNW